MDLILYLFFLWICSPQKKKKYSKQKWKGFFIVLFCEVLYSKVIYSMNFGESLLFSTPGSTIYYLCVLRARIRMSRAFVLSAQYKGVPKINDQATTMKQYFWNSKFRENPWWTKYQQRQLFVWFVTLLCYSRNSIFQSPCGSWAFVTSCLPWSYG